jgi:hypothetical protein
MVREKFPAGIISIVKHYIYYFQESTTFILLMIGNWTLRILRENNFRGVALGKKYISISLKVVGKKTKNIIS